MLVYYIGPYLMFTHKLYDVIESKMLEIDFQINELSVK